MADWQLETEQGIDMPSLNHSLLQTRLVKLIDERFVTLTELSLDLSKLDEEHRSALGASKELKPDICLYAADDEYIRFIDSTEEDDVVKVDKMPLAAIEILSPTQGMRDVYVKIRAYLALHIKSCWVVNPSMKVVAVYSPSDEQIFRKTDSEIVDSQLDIHLSTQTLFAKRL